MAAHEGTDAADAIRRTLDHPPTRVETTVERVLLEALGAGCVAPVGIHATLQGDVVQTRVQVLSRDGSETVADRRALPVNAYADAAREFAADLNERGAADLIEAARRE